MRAKFYGGIVVNYNPANTLAAYTADLADLKALGITKVRLKICTYTNGADITLWRQVVQAALNMGFHVVYGVTFNWASGATIINKANWSIYTAAVVAEAQWLAANIPAGQQANLDFQIGNELERQRFMDIATITASGTTATAVTTATHGFTTGETVYIRNATQGAYNGSFTITVTSPTAFTYTMTSSPASSATTAGTIGVTDYGDLELIAAIKALASSVAAQWGGGIVYSVPTGSPDSTGATGNNPGYWVTAGIGTALTRLGFNIYDSYPNFTKYVATMTTGFAAGKFYFSEWNIDSGSSFVASGRDEHQYRLNVMQRLATIKAKNIDAYFYAYRDATDDFGAVKVNGTPRLLWAALLGVQPWFTPDFVH